MHFFREMEWTPLNIVKTIAIGIVLLICASFVFSFVKTSLDSNGFGTPGSFAVAPHMGYGGARMEMDMADSYYGGEMAQLSARNVASSPIAPYPPSFSSGNTAEEFEVTEYSASIETDDKETTCDTLANLKGRTYVIFENANDHDRGCDYRFKVEHSRVVEVLAFIEALNPKDLSENTYTIKSMVDDFSSEVEVLEGKRRAIDDTLAEAIAAYDEISAVASANQDAESLSRIIDSKIQLIERLTQQKIEINTQLDRLARSKAEQLDRLAYTYFNVSAYENTYIDREQLADSWKEALRATIQDVNRVIQDATLGLVALVFLAVQWIIYLLIVLFVAKHVWQWGKRIWTGKPGSASAPRNGTRKTKIGSNGSA